MDGPTDLYPAADGTSVFDRALAARPGYGGGEPANLLADVYRVRPELRVRFLLAVERYWDACVYIDDDGVPFTA